MTIFITALTNAKAPHIASEHRTTCRIVARLIIDHLENSGYIVKVRKEW